MWAQRLPSEIRTNPSDKAPKVRFSTERSYETERLIHPRSCEHETGKVPPCIALLILRLNDLTRHCNSLGVSDPGKVMRRS